MDIENLVTLLKLCLVVAVNCEVTEQIIGSFTEKLNETTLDELMQITQQALKKYGKEDDDSDKEQLHDNDLAEYVEGDTLVSFATHEMLADISEKPSFMERSDFLRENSNK